MCSAPTSFSPSSSSLTLATPRELPWATSCFETTYTIWPVCPFFKRMRTPCLTFGKPSIAWGLYPSPHEAASNRSGCGHSASVRGLASEGSAAVGAAP